MQDIVGKVFMLYKHCSHEPEEMHRCFVTNMVEHAPHIADFMTLKNFWDLAGNIKHMEELLFEPLDRHMMKGLYVTVQQCVPVPDMDARIQCVVQKLHEMRHYSNDYINGYLQPVASTAGPFFPNLTMDFEGMYYASFAKLALFTCPNRDVWCVNETIRNFYETFGYCQHMQTEIHACVIDAMIQRRPDIAEFMSLRDFWDIVSNMVMMKDHTLEPVKMYIVTGIARSYKNCSVVGVVPEINCIVNELREFVRRHHEFYFLRLNHTFDMTTELVKVESFYRGLAELAIKRCPPLLGDHGCVENVLFTMLGIYRQCENSSWDFQNSMDVHACAIYSMVMMTPDVADALPLRVFWDIVTNYDLVEGMVMAPVRMFLIKGMSESVANCTMVEPMNCIVSNMRMFVSSHRNYYFNLMWPTK